MTLNSKRAVLTVLTAEIVSALRISVRLGDERWAEAHSAYEAEIKAILERWGGHAVWRSATTVTAVFADVSLAVTAGRTVLDISQHLELPVRVGLHRSEILMTGAGRAYGAGILLSGLVAAQGHPGDLLASRTVIDALPEVGHRRLAGRWVFDGSPQEWSVYSLGDQALVRESSVVTEQGSNVLPPLTTLTRRQIEIAYLLAAGMSNREIGNRLSISESTVERHISNMLLKLPFRTRSQIAAWVVSQREPT